MIILIQIQNEICVLPNENNKLLFFCNLIQQFIFNKQTHLVLHGDNLEDLELIHHMQNFMCMPLMHS